MVLKDGGQEPLAITTPTQRGVSRSKDSFVVNGCFVFQIIPIAIGSVKSPALRVAANRII
jgi:hypothetical protein